MEQKRAESAMWLADKLHRTSTYLPTDNQRHAVITQARLDQSVSDIAITSVISDPLARLVKGNLMFDSFNDDN